MIGIMGFGVVGHAVYNGFKEFENINIYDKYKDGYQTLGETVTKSDILFVCVPTLTNDQGQDLSDICCCIDAINDVAGEITKTIVIKSTVIPGTTQAFSKQYHRHVFMFNPEFLSARTADEDFINQKQIILGYDVYTSHVKSVINLYKNALSGTPIEPTTIETAELAKYMCNCMGALKVTAANQIEKAAEFLGADYSEVKRICVNNGWIADMHLDVPGHDGKYGYGGACLKKDIEAFYKWGQTNGVDLSLFETANDINKRIRK